MWAGDGLVSGGTVVTGVFPTPTPTPPTPPPPPHHPITFPVTPPLFRAVTWWCAGMAERAGERQWCGVGGVVSNRHAVRDNLEQPPGGH